jgi:hypothetical protein
MIRDSGRHVMIGLLETNRKAIAAICQKYGVKKLDVFGSAATGAFDHATRELIFDVSRNSETVA